MDKKYVTSQLTWFKLCVSIKRRTFTFLYSLEIVLVLLGLRQFSQQSKFGI